MTIPVTPDSTAADTDPPRPLTMFGPDFPFSYDDYVTHRSGLGAVPPDRHGTEVAVIGGGLSGGMVTAYELMKLGLKPIVYEADQIGGRMRSQPFDGHPPEVVAEMGAMRFPPSSTTLFHYLDTMGLRTEAFPNRSPTAPPPARSSTSRAKATTRSTSTTCRPCSGRCRMRGSARSRTTPS